MSALAHFNRTYKKGDKLTYDPAPLLGEPSVQVTLTSEGVSDEDPDFPVNKAMVTLPDGRDLFVMIDHLGPAQ